MINSPLDRRAQLIGLAAAMFGGLLVHLFYSGVLFQAGPVTPVAQQLFAAVFLFVCLVVPGFVVAQCAKQAELLNCAIFGVLLAALVAVILAVTFRTPAAALGFYAAVTLTCSLAGGILGAGLRSSFPETLND